MNITVKTHRTTGKNLKEQGMILSQWSMCRVYTIALKFYFKITYLTTEVRCLKNLKLKKNE